MPKELSMDGGDMEPRARKAPGTDTCTKEKSTRRQSNHLIMSVSVSPTSTPLSSLIAINKLTGGPSSDLTVPSAPVDFIRVVLFTILNPEESEWYSSPKTPACHVGYFHLRTDCGAGHTVWYIYTF
ncbi:hypothetical protein PAAG_11924 [Paracoccidioides lutzii Pb01]|uniref:Uncharacterized protein n=1 Tax=Paracoccidioides lutzii (strain ATCC MYA-826 / Pb01) TaxID=502779 RepID=A0A0A2V4Q9_PARBA|nr:hypothetical protein PAAG_11924 [Paracoccidioides lutzii Pb01]KGQ01347.1 hypothetical protein PAAG_11924 [Paracoccidioides lutzii Pb01]